MTVVTLQGSIIFFANVIVTLQDPVKFISNAIVTLQDLLNILRKGIFVSLLGKKKVTSYIYVIRNFLILHYPLGGNILKSENITLQYLCELLFQHAHHLKQQKECKQFSRQFLRL